MKGAFDPLEENNSVTHPGQQALRCNCSGPKRKVCAMVMPWKETLLDLLALSLTTYHFTYLSCFSAAI